MMTFMRNCLVKMTFLVILYCYDHGAKASEAIQKIATD